MSRLVIVCNRCGTRFEADWGNPEIIGCAGEHRSRCGEVELWVVMPMVEKPTGRLRNISVRYEP